MTPLLQVALTARGTTIAELSGGGDVVLLAPHPDDETLGCGAAIAARIAAQNPKLRLWSYAIWGRFAPLVPDFDPATVVQFATEAWQPRKSGSGGAHASQMTGLIADDPAGFLMTDAQQAHFIATPELYLKQG
jgi:hypothetical protein